VAYRRGAGLITVVPRLLMKLQGEWGDAVLELPEGRWRNHLTGENLPHGAVSVGDLLRKFPVAFLLREEER